MLQKIRIVALWVVVVLIAFSYNPLISDMSESLEQGSVLSGYIDVAYIALFLLSFRLDCWKSRMVRVYVVLLTLFALMLGIAYSIGEVQWLNPIKALLIPLIGICIGWNLQLSDRQKLVTHFLFIACVLYTTLMQIFVNGSGFVIEERYFADNKNALAGLCATASVLALSLSFSKERRLWVRILAFFLSLVVITGLLTIRGRAATLITAACIIFMVFKKFDSRSAVLAVLGTAAAVFILLLILPDGVKDFIYNSFTLNKEGDLTNDRAHRNSMAIAFLGNNLMLGNIFNTAPEFGLIHNFPLLQIFNYGLVFSFFELALYVYVAYVLAVGNLRRDIFRLEYVGYLLLLVPFGLSMAEPSFPFGPGTVTVYNFICFGAALKADNFAADGRLASKLI